MNELTPIDHAHFSMTSEENNPVARLEFYERISDAELFILLENEPAGETIEPRIFPVEGEKYVLVFDREERLAEFSGSIVPYAALSGRALAGMLAGQGIGLGVNLDVAPSSILIPPVAVKWLATMSGAEPVEEQDTPLEFGSPHQIPEAVLKSLDTKLVMTGALAKSAYLVSTRYKSGHRGHLLGFVDAVDGSQLTISRSVAEALVFSGVELGAIDVAFFARHDPVCAKLAKVGLRFDLPEHSADARKPKAPGMDPENPPRLR